MMNKRRVVAVPSCALLAAAAMLAQWTPGGASAATEHPDLSGVWIEYGVKGPVLMLGTPDASSKLPFTLEGRKRVDAFRRLLGPKGDRPGNWCLGSGMPESMMFSGVTGQYPMEIIQRPEQIVIIYESHTEVRHLYFDGKILPEDDRVPARNGYSAAHWEGETLVVETTALKEQEDQAYPHSEQARIVERYRLLQGPKNTRQLVVEWTLTDPVFYATPVTGGKTWVLDPHGILLPYECTESTWLDHLDVLKAKSTGAQGAVK
jgi:hypothetical protein